jgi:hypothetical protein
MITLWVDANAGGVTSRKNEAGFWITQLGDDFIAGPTLLGTRNFITRVMERRPTLASIWFHVHPFTIAEGFPQGLDRPDSIQMNRNPWFYYITFTHQGWIEFPPTRRRGH